jgi:endonuclease/exonuclease/phosphatase family metal-dependent hydrolase
VLSANQLPGYSKVDKRLPPHPDSLDTGLMILSKYPILESKTLFYDDRNPKEIFSKKGALRAKIQLPQEGDNGKDYFYVITTHLDARICFSQAYVHKAHVPEIRQKQLSQLVEEFVKPLENEKVVLVGDFNVHCPSYASKFVPPHVFRLASKDDDSSEYSKLLTVLQPFQDLRQLGNIESEPTYQDGSPCLDYVFLLNTECDFSTFTVQKNWKDAEEVSISDHYGLSVDLLF